MFYGFLNREYRFIFKITNARMHMHTHIQITIFYKIYEVSEANSVLLIHYILIYFCFYAHFLYILMCFTSKIYFVIVLG